MTTKISFNDAEVLWLIQQMSQILERTSRKPRVNAETRRHARNIHSRLTSPPWMT
jgi:hypothetical protein